MLNSGTILQQRYKIVKILGDGGMGAVYLVEDQRLPTTWAIKEMKKDGLSDEERAEAAELFHTEARLLSELRHRNLPRIVDFFEQDQQMYLVMDCVEGQTLEEKLAESGPLPLQYAMEMCLQIADVLDYLHTRDNPIVFRDFKPGNVMLTENDEVKLIDFGIARVFKKDANTDTKALGTPGYAAPEQYGRGQSGPRTDLYAFGATIHHVLSGRDPTEEPFQFPPLTDFREDLPAEFVEILESCLSLKTKERPESAFAVKRVLEQLLGRTGSTTLATGRATTSKLDHSAAPPAQEVPAVDAAPAKPAPQTRPISPVVASNNLPTATFNPSTLQVKSLAHGDKATMRLKVKVDQAVTLVCDSPHVQIYPDKVGPGTISVTVSINSAKMEAGSLFNTAIEVNDLDELSVPIEAKITEAKASVAAVLGMYTLTALTLIPGLNFITTVIGGIVMSSTAKPKRQSLKLPWRLNLLFTLCWTGAFIAVAFGLSQVDWSQVQAMLNGWGIPL